ncbi:MAG: alpha/beta fold hydrolase [Pseudomonadota bacterium]
MPKTSIQPLQQRAIGLTVRLWFSALIAIALLVYAAWSFLASASGVVTTTTHIGPTPITVHRAAGTPESSPRPLVVIAHGFAGSQQLMSAFATTLARNGYLAVTFDFAGHGRHLAPMEGDVTQIEGATVRLVTQLREVVEVAKALPGAGDQLAVLGHSMASDIVVRYAQQNPTVDATVAVSMFSPAVTADTPRNLLIIVGEWEKYLRTEALRVLRLSAPEATENQTVRRADGSQRRVAVADNVEHVSVLYSEDTLGETVRWLNASLDHQSRGYLDLRGPPTIALLAGIVLLAWPLSWQLPRVSPASLGANLPWRRLLPVAVVPALVTPFVLIGLPANFFGVLVGGYVAVHFLVYGLLTAIMLMVVKGWRGARGLFFAPARWVLAATITTAYCAVLISLALDRYVTSFALTPLRLPLVVLMLAGTLIYFVTDEWATRGLRPARGGHLFTRICFLASLGVAVALSPQDLFFLLIIAAVIVIYFLIYGLFSRWAYRATGHPGVGSVANAVAFAWALAAVFPIMSGQ